MPVLVRDPPHASATTLTLDIAERQLMVGYRADQFIFHQRICWIRIDGGRWIVTSPTLDTYEEDFTGQEVLPLARAGGFPLAERPFFCFAALSDADYARLRTAALQLADILGVTFAPATQPGNAQWYFSSTAYGKFGETVPIAQASDPTLTRVQESTGMGCTSTTATVGCGPRWKA